MNFATFRSAVTRRLLRIQKEVTVSLTFSVLHPACLCSC